MTDTGSTPALTPALRIQLAITGANIRRWYGLKRLWNEMQAANGSTEGLETLAEALDESFEAAAAEGGEVAALLEANSEQINALLASDRRASGAPEDMHGYFGNPGSDDAQRIADGLRELSAPTHGSAFCAIANYMFVTAYGECEDGVAGACGQAWEYLNDLLVYCPMS